MSEAAYSQPGLRPALGRLSNAMVAALGPELQRGSPAFKLCKSVIREMQVIRCLLLLLLLLLLLSIDGRISSPGQS